MKSNFSMLATGLMVIVLTWASVFSYFYFFANGNSAGLGVALLDVDRVARELGRDVKINQALYERKTTLEAEFSALRSSLQENFAARKKELGDNPNEEQQAELQALEKALNAKADQAMMLSQKTQDQYRQLLLKNLRDELKLVAEAIGAKRGAEMVVLSNPDVFLSVNRSLDITDEVVAKLKQESP